jgi:hypothetical protein
MKVPILLALLGLATVQAAAEPTGTLTLACQGTTTMTSMPDAKPDPISMGLILNFTAGTVQGFGHPGVVDFPVKITGMNDVTIAFSDSDQKGIWTITGTLDRVTYVWANHTANTKTNVIVTEYALKCKPTQRMF